MPRFQLPWRSAARIQADVDEELRFELDMRARELMERGVPEREARRRAVAEFGDLEGTRAYCAALDREAERERRRGEWLAELRHDARQTWRGLRRTPGFALVVLLTLALGIGADTAVFSVVRRVLLERLPYREPDRLLRLYGATASHPGARAMLTAAELEGLQGARRSFSMVAPFGMAGGYTFVGDRDTEVWQGMAVGPTFFRTLGAGALLGRTLDERDLAPDAPRAVLLGHALWQRTFGGDPAIVGRTVQLDGQPAVVVGVMGAAFVSPTFVADAWTALDLAPFAQGRGRHVRIFRAVARLADGATVDGAGAELAVVARRADDMADTRPAADAPRIDAVPLRAAMVGEARPVLLVVMGAAALVLVVACVNVAGLFLARATARRREIALRTALGAGRGRLVRQLLTESALVGLAGGALGVALAYWGKDVLVRVGARVIPVIQSSDGVRIDGGVLAFAVAISLASGALFGLVPALLGTRADVGRALAESSRGAAGGRVRARAGRLLVAGQIALAVVLLVGAGLLGRTLVALERVGVGHATDAHVLTFRVNLVRARYPDPASRAAFFDALLARVRAMPGVRSAGLVGISPWNGWNHEPVVVAGRAEPAEGGPPSAAYASVSDGFLATLAIPLRAGRPLGDDDRATSAPVVLVSETLARQLWPGASPLGARVRVGAAGTPWREVVGVVGDVRASASADPEAVAYVPASQAPSGGNELVVRTAGDARRLLPAVRAALREMDPALPLVTPRTMDEVFRDTLAGQRLPMLFTTAFASLALVLAALGVYGVTAYAVAARTREFGIRAALGARRGGVLWLVLRQGLATALVGIAAGLAVAAGASRVLAGLLVGVTTHDAVTFVATPLLLLAVAAAACLVPARRATRSDPVGILRAD